VFRPKGGVVALEDLGSALDTSVNGTPIKVHELKSGGVAIGSLRIEFGQGGDAAPVERGANVRSASSSRDSPRRAPRRTQRVAAR
jgi:hypothetical protein